ncbi:MAG: Crp/Fnr family transcriptional regulator, partial [Thermodesulfobacteriota bacterium]
SGNVLFVQGDPADRCYLVKQGRLKLSRVNEDGKEVTIRYISKGEITAVITVIKKSEYSVTARAMEDTLVVAWEQSVFLKLMKRFPGITVNILTMVLTRLDDLQDRYSELCTEQVEQRIALTLLRFIRTSGTRRSDGICINIPLSRQDLAEYIGTTLFTVSRTLSDWKKRGWIKSEQKRLIITDPHAVVSFAEKI